MSQETLKTDSKVEQIALRTRNQLLIHPPVEKIGVIVVNNFPALGKITALRFIEWALENPGGAISLPTGKTPEHFIKYLTHYLRTWNTAETQKELSDNGITAKNRPDMSSFHFIQIDEFYPIDSAQHNSFYYYVEKYYIRGFGLDPDKALLIDCLKIGLPENTSLEYIWPNGEVDLSLRYRHPITNLEHIQKCVLEEIDQWCHDYERKIQALGGIGFFLGGIGPDGHIAFNVAGSDHNTTTRLTPTNYETQAAAADDLGGIEVAKKRLAITIGLQTITYNPDCTAIIMAAGDAKARVVSDGVCQKPHVRYPSTALQKLQKARFYLTAGAAKSLLERKYKHLVQTEQISDKNIEKLVIDLALLKHKRILDLTEEDFKNDRLGCVLIKKADGPIRSLVQKIHSNLAAKVEAGSYIRSNTVFLHTAPHHDDIMLGYFAHITRHIRNPSNKHTFTYMTSGFNAITNHYALSMVENLRYFMETQEFHELLDEKYFSPLNQHARNRDVWQYLDGIAANSIFMKQEGEARRLFRNLMEIFEEDDAENLGNRIHELANYLRTQYSGKKDMPHIQKMKGMIREWEADCLWGFLGFDNSSVKHLRLGFYKGEIFTEEPTIHRDVTPILHLLRDVKPDVVTVALDPEASGPDTHYKVLQAVAEALRRYEEESKRSDITIWGYRNVWYRFHPSEIDLFIPVSLNMFSGLQNGFNDAFVSQKDASFPSHEYDGPFSGLSQQIQVDQYQKLKTCLGRQFFNDHERPLIRAARGFVFLRQMTLSEFYTHAREIKKTTEEF